MKSQPENAWEIIASNLSGNSSDIAGEIEVRFGMLVSLLEEAGAEHGTDISENAELTRLAIRKLGDAPDIVPSGASPDICRKYLQSYSAALNVSDKVTVCRMICERLEITDSESVPYRLLEPDQQPAADFGKTVRISYRKAHGTDIAFEKFASLIPDSAAMYKDDFAAVCDSVALGEADMCILPYENTSDGRLLGFYRLMDSYELRIAASCMVPSDSRGDETRYVLLCAGLSGLSECTGITDFEFSLSDRDGKTLANVLCAANLLGIKIKSVDTVKSEPGCVVCLVRTSAETESLNALIMFLKLEALEFSPLGLYAAAV